MARHLHAEPLWVAWCTVTGHDPDRPDPVVAAAYRRQVPNGSVPVLVDAVQTSPVDRSRAWDTTSIGLDRFTTQGWPDGFRGRRDAWLWLCVEGLGLGVQRSLSLRASDVRCRADIDDTAGTVTVGRVVVPHLGTADGPAPGGGSVESCPACAVARWLLALAEAMQWGRSAARALLAAPALRSHGEHDQALGLALERLPAWSVLAPAIDQHGWLCEWRPMSRRAASTILQRARQSDPADQEPASATPALDAGRLLAMRPPEPDRPWSEGETQAVYRRADEVNARIRVLLGETERALSRPRRGHPPTKGS